VWVRPSDGTVVAEITGSQRGIGTPRLSPDGRSLALAIAGDIWRYDLDRHPPIQLTFDGGRVFPKKDGNELPVWTAREGSRIVYESAQGPLASVSAQGGDGTPEPASPPGHFHPHDWSPDGREILALRWTEDGRPRDLVRLPPRMDGPVQTIIPVTTNKFNAALSPDGRWLAYTSNLSGRDDVWVRPYAESGTARQVSVNGGAEPVWARDGRKLFFISGSDMMEAPVVPVAPNAAFGFDTPTRLFDVSAYRQPFSQAPTYDVARDGRFVMLKSSDFPVTVIHNWTERLRQRAAVGPSH
jgi:serine/threonine-protein kinase